MFKKKPQKHYVIHPHTHILLGLKLNQPFKQSGSKQRYGPIELIKLEKLHITLIQTLMKDFYSFHGMWKCFFVK